MDFLKRFSIYYLIISFLLALYLLGILQFGLEKILFQFLPPVLATTFVGALLDYIELKRWTKPKTPFITGLIIGLVAQFGAGIITLSIIGVLAMLIKFFIKWDGRHIFNPAGAGLLAGIVLLHSQPSWWAGGGNIWPYFIWIPIFLYKFKRWAPMVGFLLPLIILNGINILFSSSLLFFTSVMLIEPKTSPAPVKSGLIYGFLVSVFYLLISQTNFDPFIPSLLIANLGARLLNKFLI